MERLERDHYKVLQVHPQAEDAVIKAAFRALARKLHPDRDTTGVEAQRMSELNRAYAVLRDPEKRKAYDRERALRPGANAGSQVVERATPPESSAPQQPSEARVDFGRYAGLTLREIADRDRSYLTWLGQHSSGLRFRRAIDELLRANGR